MNVAVPTPHIPCIVTVHQTQVNNDEFYLEIFILVCIIKVVIH